MQIKIDLNADVGEGLETDAGLMPWIASANIACGYHAGDRDTMLRTVSLSKEYGVAVGAHPSFADRAHFGRSEMVLSPEEIRTLIIDQLGLIQEVCQELDAVLHHVKPHGALYNMSARDGIIARAIAEAVAEFNPNLILYGLSGSHSIAEGVMAGLQTTAEVFADRTYQPDGTLTPRSQPNALIESEEKALEQAWMMVTENRVQAVDGTLVPLQAESICLHGDGPNALSFARLIHQTFVARGITIQAV